MGKQWKQWLTLFFWAPKSLQMVTAALKLKDASSLEEKYMTNLDSILESRDITLPTKVKAMVFPVVMYGCENWTIKKAEHQRIDAFELWYWRRLLRVSWIAKEIQPVHPKGNQSWIFIGRADAEAEALILWPPDAKNWLIRKDADAVKDWRQEENGMTEDKMVGWHHWLNGKWVWASSTRRAAVHGVKKNQTWLSNWTELMLLWLTKFYSSNQYHKYNHMPGGKN